MKNKIPYVIEKEFNKYEEVLDFIKLRLEKKDNLPTTYFSFHILTDEGEFVVTQGEAEIFFDFAFSFKSERSILPNSSQLITTIFIPAITAEAGFVPCADDGISAMLRCKSPRSA